MLLLTQSLPYEISARVSRKHARPKPKPAVRPSHISRKEIPTSAQKPGGAIDVETGPARATQELSQEVSNLKLDDAKALKKMACRFHPGRVINKVIASTPLPSIFDSTKSCSTSYAVKSIFLFLAVSSTSFI
jgi:hypothetical protein